MENTVLEYYNDPLLLIDVGQFFLATQWPRRILVSIDRPDEFDPEEFDPESGHSSACFPADSLPRNAAY